MSVIKGSLWFDRKKGFYGSFCLNSSKLFTISGIGQKDDKNDNDFHLSQRKRRNEGLSPFKIWILSCTGGPPLMLFFETLEKQQCKQKTV